MLAVRLHLDPCTSDNGPVRVLTGSHASGRLSPAAIDQWRSQVPVTECVVEVGGLLLFRPLLLHASSSATRPGHRRVLHIEYGPPILPGGVQWHTWVPSRPSRAA
jgi:ectoine hydroxylase-related dioxygenase (phytanoyl-CoA dioxygenase family)